MLKVISDFITTYTSMPEDNIFIGYQNRMSLPAEALYAVIFVESTARIGTNVLDQSLASEGQITSKVMREYAVNVDFAGLDQNAVLQMASTLENIGRSYIAVDFFADYGASFTYCDDLQYLPYVTQQDQYIHRYRLILHYTVWEEVTIAQQYADTVEINRVENIDADHKPE